MIGGRWLRHGVLFCALIVCLPGRNQARGFQQQSNVGLPTVARAALPIYPPIANAARMSGVVVLNVTTDGAAISRTEVVKSAGLLDKAAEENVRTWSFEPHPATTFEVAYSFVLDSEDWHCGRPPSTVIAKLPTEVMIKAAPYPICDPSSPMNGYRAVNGIVTCACPGQRPVAGAKIQVLNARSSVVRTTETDGSGRFLVRGLPDGRYEIRAQRERFEEADVGIVVSNRRGADGDVYLQLQMDLPRLDGADLPVLPSVLRSQSAQGVVELRIENGRVVRIAGDEALAGAAEANLKSWRYTQRTSSPIDVTYRYAFRAASDCAADSRDHVSVSEDGQVSVTTCRR